jgi:hypothetical protein
MARIGDGLSIPQVAEKVGVSRPAAPNRPRRPRFATAGLGVVGD